MGLRRSAATFGEIALLVSGFMVPVAAMAMTFFLLFLVHGVRAAAINVLGQLVALAVAFLGSRRGRQLNALLVLAVAVSVLVFAAATRAGGHSNL